MHFSEENEELTAQDLLELAKAMDDMLKASKTVYQDDLAGKLKSMSDQLCRELEATPEELTRRATRTCS